MLSEFFHRSSIRKIDGYWFERLSRPNQLKHFNIRINNYVAKLSQLEDVFRFLNTHFSQVINEICINDYTAYRHHLNQYIHEQIIDTLIGKETKSPISLLMNAWPLLRTIHYQ
ncbi:unnamed protein product [Caenorhabditis nigoni]